MAIQLDDVAGLLAAWRIKGVCWDLLVAQVKFGSHPVHDILIWGGASVAIADVCLNWSFEVLLTVKSNFEIVNVANGAVAFLLL